MKERVILTGVVHRRNPTPGLRITLCGITIPMHTHGTYQVTTCLACLRTVVEPPRRGRPPGSTIAPLPERVEVDLRCECGAHDRRELDAEASARKTLAGLSCQRCGALGKMKLCAAPIEEPRELPPHPEEPS